MWVGTTSFNKDMLFISPDEIDPTQKPSSATRIVNGVVYLRSPSVWFTNLDHGRRHLPLRLLTMKDNLRFNKKMKGVEYQKFDNYDAINIPFTDAIPSDYEGAMGVPITFLDKYSPEQFEIISSNDIKTNDKVSNKEHGLIKDNDGKINGIPTYVRLVIRKRR
jgi:hypothetical protein